MQNRIDKLFTEKRENILSVFFTAGFPTSNGILKIIEYLEQAGVDMIEVGIPFSDPLADGSIIQESSTVALNNGIILKKIFSELATLRITTKTPILLMGYLNSLIQFGIESFYRTCSEVGIDGIIIPDLPAEEFESQHKVFAERYNIHVVFLITPQTSKERILKLDKISRGFIYLVSSNATTGTDKGIAADLTEKVKQIKDMNLINPLLMGFGIKGNKEFTRACSLVNGAIVGSSFVNMLKSSKDPKNDISAFISSIRNPEKQFQL